MDKIQVQAFLNSKLTKKQKKQKQKQNQTDKKNPKAQRPKKPQNMRQMKPKKWKKNMCAARQRRDLILFSQRAAVDKEFQIPSLFNAQHKHEYHSLHWNFGTNEYTAVSIGILVPRNTPSRRETAMEYLPKQRKSISTTDWTTGIPTRWIGFQERIVFSSDLKIALYSMKS